MRSAAVVLVVPLGRAGGGPVLHHSSRALSIPAVPAGLFPADRLFHGVVAGFRDRPRGETAGAARARRFQRRIDSLGFSWDVLNQFGQVQSGVNNCFSQSFILNVNGQQFRPQGQGMMTADASEFFLHGSVPGQNVDIVRQIKVDARTPGIRYVEVFRNPSPAPLSVVVAIIVSMNGFQAVASDGGVNAPASLGKRETGLVIIGNQGSVAVYLASRDSRLKPSIQVQQNQSNVLVSYSLTIPAGKAAAIAYGALQCRLTALPDAKAAAALLKPFAASKWLRDLPAELRHGVANIRTSGFGDDEGDDESPAEIASLEVAPGPTDVLAIGPQTRLKGAAAGGAFTLQTDFGPIHAALQDVAAVAGMKRTGRDCRVFFRDGQVLHGKLQIEGLKFTTHGGMEIPLTPERLDRLVIAPPRARGNRPKTSLRRC